MKLLTSVCGVIAVLALVGIATGQDKDAVKEEMKKLDGTWTPAWLVLKGEKKNFKVNAPIKYFGFNEVTTIKGGRMTITLEGDTLPYSITVDPTKKPKTLDRVVTEGAFKGTTYSYLYELERDTLRLCFDNEKRDAHPKEFKSEGTLMILIFERKKP